MKHFLFLTALLRDVPPSMIQEKKMMIGNNTPVTFTSKIKFVSEDEFKSRTAEEARNYTNRLYIGPPWDEAIAGPKGLTEDIYGCNAGGLTNTVSKDAVLFHFKPAAAKYPTERFQDKISTALGQLGQYTQSLGALIIGGKTAASGDMNYENSQTLSKKLEQFCHDVKASVTKFWGQKTAGGHTNIFYSGDEDTWYVNYKRDDYDHKAIQTPDDIKKAYYTIEVSDNDDVFIDDRPVDKFDLKQGFKKIDGGYELDLNPPGPHYQPQYDYSDPKFKERSKVNLFTADFGRDPTTLWIEPKRESQVLQVLEKLNEIKEAPLFSQIEKVQYQGKECIEGFKAINKNPDGTIVFEREIL
jgi:hypothetical protein